MKRIISAVLVAVLVSGCTSSTVVEPPYPGTVVDKARRSVTVKHDDGQTVRHPVSKSNARRCQIGERWPEC